MNLIDRINALAARGERDQARQLVERAAGSGDAQAQFVLASWRLWGEFGPRDLAVSHRLLRAAGDAGLAEATLLRASLLANGTGVDADWAGALALLRSVATHTGAARQLCLLDGMQLESDGAPASVPELLRISERPNVWRAAGALTAAECDYLIHAAEPRLEPSFVIDKQGQRIPHPIRSSQGTSFGPAHEDLVVRAINQRLAALTGTHVSWGEPLHMLRYLPGEQYRPHLDAIPGEPNQRIMTALVYLNEGYQGGKTLFTEMNLTVQAGTGDVAVFRNVGLNGQPDTDSRHAGMPVERGIKWLATRWIRAGHYHPWGL